jgi:hypothetical protein
MNEVVINKVWSIQRCVRGARAEYQADPGGFADNFTRQDAVLLNVLRACETAIDLATSSFAPAARVFRSPAPTASGCSGRRA